MRRVQLLRPATIICPWDPASCRSKAAAASRGSGLGKPECGAAAADRAIRLTPHHQRLIEMMRKAGFPTSSTPAVIAPLANAVSLPECRSQEPRTSTSSSWSSP